MHLFVLSMEIIVAWQAYDLPDEIIEGLEHLYDQGNFLSKLTRNMKTKLVKLMELGIAKDMDFRKSCNVETVQYKKKSCIFFSFFSGGKRRSKRSYKT